MATVVICAIVGAVGGATGGFLLGGVPGAAAAGQAGAFLGSKVGIYAGGFKVIEGVVDKTTTKILEIVDLWSKNLLKLGTVGSIFWFTTKNMQEICIRDSQHPTCHLYPYTNYALYISSGLLLVKMVRDVLYVSANTEKPVEVITDKPKDPDCYCHTYFSTKNICIRSAVYCNQYCHEVIFPWISGKLHHAKPKETV